MGTAPRMAWIGLGLEKIMTSDLFHVPSNWNGSDAGMDWSCTRQYNDLFQATGMERRLALISRVLDKIMTFVLFQVPSNGNGTDASMDWPGTE